MVLRLQQKTLWGAKKGEIVIIFQAIAAGRTYYAYD